MGAQEGDRKSTRLNSSHTEIYTLSLHDALPILTINSLMPSASIFTMQHPDWALALKPTRAPNGRTGRRSEEHTSELQSHRDLHSFPTRRSSDLDDQLIDAVGIYFHHATPGLGARLEAYKSPEWAHRKEWGERHLEKFVRGMKYFDGVLKAHPYVAGDDFSIADITVYAALMHAGAAGIAIPDDCSALSAWQAKISERPSVKNRSGQVMELPA